MKIYIDLDGVLCNMKKALYEIGISFDELSRGMAVKEVWHNSEFFENLEWMPGGKELWEYFKSYEPIILSSPGRRENTEVVAGKIKWLNREIPGCLRIFEPDKYRYAMPYDVLIDDSKIKIKDWRQKSGIGILHRNTEDTIKQFEDI